MEMENGLKKFKPTQFKRNSIFKFSLSTFADYTAMSCLYIQPSTTTEK